MRVEPITPVYNGQEAPLRHRAAMSIRHTMHTVKDLKTGQEHVLPAKQAWDLYDKLNIEV